MGYSMALLSRHGSCGGPRVRESEKGRAHAGAEYGSVERSGHSPDSVVAGVQYFSVAAGLSANPNYAQFGCNLVDAKRVMEVGIPVTAAISPACRTDQSVTSTVGLYCFIAICHLLVGRNLRRANTDANLSFMFD